MAMVVVVMVATIHKNNAMQTHLTDDSSIRKFQPVSTLPTFRNNIHQVREQLKLGQTENKHNGRKYFFADCESSSRIIFHYQIELVDSFLVYLERKSLVEILLDESWSYIHPKPTLLRLYQSKLGSGIDCLDTVVCKQRNRCLLKYLLTFASFKPNSELQSKINQLSGGNDKSQSPDDMKIQAVLNECHKLVQERPSKTLRLGKNVG